MSETINIGAPKELRLRIGGRDTGITIIPWFLEPKLWCIRWHDGRLSPPGNLTRAKEAAIMFARQQPGVGWANVHQWKRSATRSEGPTAREAAFEVPDSHAPVEGRPEAS